jgi:hypothetical protein
MFVFVLKFSIRAYLCLSEPVKVIVLSWCRHYLAYLCLSEHVKAIVLSWRRHYLAYLCLF